MATLVRNLKLVGRALCNFDSSSPQEAMKTSIKINKNKSGIVGRTLHFAESVYPAAAQLTGLSNRQPVLCPNIPTPIIIPKHNGNVLPNVPYIPCPQRSTVSPPWP